jgi:glutamyl-Q tRNA(Asp) synthetase
MPPPVFRFAPSPNGYLHLGHAYSALLNTDLARRAGGRLLLRIEDIDTTRCRPEFEAAIVEDLAWLSIEWETPVRRQSEHLDVYRDAVEKLAAQGLVYPAFESRAEIAKLVAQREAKDPWPRDPDGAPLYPGTAKSLSSNERARLLKSGAPYALRLDMEAARARAGDLAWVEHGEGPDGETGTVAARPQAWGDVILARKETPTSYHLSVVLDDALQGVTDLGTSPAAATPGPPAAGLPPSPARARRRRAEIVQVNQSHRRAGTAYPTRDPDGHPPPGRPALIRRKFAVTGPKNAPSVTLQARPWHAGAGRVGESWRANRAHGAMHGCRQSGRRQNARRTPLRASRVPLGPRRTWWRPRSPPSRMRCARR